MHFASCLLVFFCCSHTNTSALCCSNSSDDTWKVRLYDTKWHNDDTLWETFLCAIRFALIDIWLYCSSFRWCERIYYLPKYLPLVRCCLSSFFTVHTLPLSLSRSVPLGVAELFACQSNLSYHICDFHFCVGIFIFPTPHTHIFSFTVIHLTTKINWYESGKA